ncbi:hypothetical protein GGI20_002470 [Coemansia sp. BCRC 34301]|nr:hypothetical protein GGI20_002470 [Coemansia sp. BCRC 34301]
MTTLSSTLEFLRRPIPTTATTNPPHLYGAPTAEEKVVLDIGTHMVRAGFSGDHSPVHSQVLELALEEDELEAQLISHLRPMYARSLLIDARTRKVAIVENGFSGARLRAALARVLEGNLRVPDVTYYPSSVAALMTTGSVDAGLVVDCGHRVAVVTPVAEARSLSAYATVTPLSGSALFASLRRLLISYARFTPANGSECESVESVLSHATVSHIMQHMLLASPASPPPSLHKSVGGDSQTTCMSRDLISFYEASTTCTAPVTSLTIDSAQGRGCLSFPGWIRERAAEPLFCGDSAADHQSIPDAVVRSIEKTPVDLRRALVARILVIGGVADMPGFGHRLLHDVVERLRRDPRWSALAADAALAGRSSACAFAPSDRAWIGTSLAVAAKIGPP